MSPRGRRGADPGPRPVASSLDPVLARMAGPRGAPPAALFARWEEIAGPRLAAHTKPVGLSDGVLAVSVDQPARATAVRAEAGELLDRARQLTGMAVTRLTVSVRRG